MSRNSHPHRDMQKIAPLILEWLKKIEAHQPTPTDVQGKQSALNGWHKVTDDHSINSEIFCNETKEFYSYLVRGIGVKTKDNTILDIGRYIDQEYWQFSPSIKIVRETLLERFKALKIIE